MVKWYKKISCEKISKLKRINSDIEKIEHELICFGYIELETQLKLNNLRNELKQLIKTL